jgi:NAD-dependent dihydropyrimidine dehydrogenase PreA subunit
MKWAGEKEESMRGAFEKVLETISDMPVAITDTFFTQPESLEKGAGELFSLAIDPHACTGCGLCAELCEDDALEMQPQEAAHLPIMQAGFQLWEQLPDTPGSTITRLNHDPSYDPFASILLSRNFYLSMAGASPTEKGLGAKAMLHNITALTESLVQPHLLTQSQQLQQQIDQLREQIEAKWKDALSLAGLEPSQAIFDATGTDRMSMKEWVSKLDETTHLKPLEVSLLKRKLNLASALKNLNGLLEEGPTGAGRSRYGLVLLDTDLGDWSDSYPLNVFCAPVALSSDGSGVEKVIGLVRGYLRHMIDNLKLMRRADLELGKKGTYEPEVDDKVLAALQWEDLTGEEKHFIPPILLLGSKRLLTEKPFAQLQQLLASNWPVKLIILDDGRLPADENAPAALLQSSSMILSALAMNNSFVLQSSMADPRHLFFGLKEGMEKEGPALFHLLAPETADNSWPRMPHKSLKTRHFPLLISRPSGSQKPLLSELLELEANPKPGETWVETSLGGEDQALSYHLTLADSLYEQAEWEGHFKAFSEAMGTATSLADYLKLEEGEKAGKVPVIFRIDASGQRETWVPSNAVLAVTAVGLFRWQRLQEIGGLLSPFPLKLKAQVEQELKEKYEREAAALRAELTEARNHFEEAHLRQIKAKLKDKLLSLSQKGKG